MTGFSRGTLRACSVLVEDLGFRFSWASSGQFFAALVRRLSESVCFYLFFKDGRTGSGVLSCYCWIAPLDFPDDGFDNLGIGFKVFLASTFDDEQVFYSTAMAKVRLLLEHVDGLVRATEEEIETPPAGAIRLAAYRRQVALYRYLEENAPVLGSLGLEQVRRSAKEVARGRGSYRGLESACEAFARGLLSASKGPNAPDLTLLGLVEEEPFLVALDMARQYYIEALVTD